MFLAINLIEMPNRAKARPLLIFGEHATVKSLGRRQRPRGFPRRVLVVERNQGRNLTQAYSVAMTLASLLYPKNFPQQLASGLDRKTTYSKRVVLGKRSQKGIEGFYKNINKGHYPFSNTDFRIHRELVSEKAEKEAQKIEQESGIVINSAEMNVGLEKKRGNIVFFEVGYLEIPKLKEKIESLPERNEQQRLIKKQARSLFEYLEKLQLKKGSNVLGVH